MYRERLQDEGLKASILQMQQCINRFLEDSDDTEAQVNDLQNRIDSCDAEVRHRATAPGALQHAHRRCQRAPQHARPPEPALWGTAPAAPLFVSTPSTLGRALRR